MERRLSVSAQKFKREVCRPSRFRKPAELGGNKNLVRTFFQELPDNLFAAAQPVDIRRVKKINSTFGCGSKSIKRSILIDLAPVGTSELPGSQTDLRHFLPRMIE